jgi:enediyne biosynthesis protein E4
MRFHSRYPFLIVLLPVFTASLYLAGCSSDADTRFEELSSRTTGIDFVNRVENTPEFNIQNYLYFYDGGGVGAGDIDNDGLPGSLFCFEYR